MHDRGKRRLILWAASLLAMGVAGSGLMGCASGKLNVVVDAYKGPLSNHGDTLVIQAASIAEAARLQLTSIRGSYLTRQEFKAFIPASDVWLINRLLEMYDDPTLESATEPLPVASAMTILEATLHAFADEVTTSAQALDRVGAELKKAGPQPDQTAAEAAARQTDQKLREIAAWITRDAGFLEEGRKRWQQALRGARSAQGVGAPVERTLGGAPDLRVLATELDGARTRLQAAAGGQEAIHRAIAEADQKLRTAAERARQAASALEGERVRLVTETGLTRRIEEGVRQIEEHLRTLDAVDLRDPRVDEMVRTVSDIIGRVLGGTLGMRTRAEIDQMAYAWIRDRQQLLREKKKAEEAQDREKVRKAEERQQRFRHQMIDVLTNAGQFGIFSQRIPIVATPSGVRRGIDYLIDEWLTKLDASRSGPGMRDRDDPEKSRADELRARERLLDGLTVLGEAMRVMALVVGGKELLEQASGRREGATKPAAGKIDDPVDLVLIGTMDAFGNALLFAADTARQEAGFLRRMAQQPRELGGLLPKLESTWVEIEQDLRRSLTAGSTLSPEAAQQRLTRLVEILRSVVVMTQRVRRSPEPVPQADLTTHGNLRDQLAREVEDTIATSKTPTPEVVRGLIARLEQAMQLAADIKTETSALLAEGDWRRSRGRLLDLKRAGLEDQLLNSLAQGVEDLGGALSEAQTRDRARARGTERAIRTAQTMRPPLERLRPAGEYLRAQQPGRILLEALVEEEQDLKKAAKRLIGTFDNLYWERVNTVEVKGFGKGNYVLYKDDIGNWNLKAYSDDRTLLVKAVFGSIIAAADLALKAATGGSAEVTDLLAARIKKLRESSAAATVSADTIRRQMAEARTALVRTVMPDEPRPEHVRLTDKAFKAKVVEAMKAGGDQATADKVREALQDYQKALLVIRGGALPSPGMP